MIFIASLQFDNPNYICIIHCVVASYVHDIVLLQIASYVVSYTLNTTDSTKLFLHLLHMAMHG